MAKKTLNHKELGDFTFADIEEVNVTVKIKGKRYALCPKNGNEREAKINRHTALYMMLDEHFVALPSINGSLSFREIFEKSRAVADMAFVNETDEQ